MISGEELYRALTGLHWRARAAFKGRVKPHRRTKLGAGCIGRRSLALHRLATAPGSLEQLYTGW